MSTAPSTQAFGWARPIREPSQKKGTNDSPKPIANPLLMGSYNGGTSFVNGIQSPPHARFPFSPVENATLKRRKPLPVSPKANSPVFLPPKLSLTTHGPYLGVMDSTNTEDDQPTLTHTEDTLDVWDGADENNLERWVLVFGYATLSQFNQIVDRFETFGRITARRGICRPGTTNWVAFQYDAIIQAEKALCQHACMLSDGVFIGVTRVNYSLKSSLDWTAPEMTQPISNSKGKTGINGHEGKLLNDDDIFLESHDCIVRSNGTKGVTQRCVEFLFGWN